MKSFIPFLKETLEPFQKILKKINYFKVYFEFEEKRKIRIQELIKILRLHVSKIYCRKK